MVPLSGLAIAARPVATRTVRAATSHPRRLHVGGKLGPLLRCQRLLRILRRLLNERACLAEPATEGDAQRLRIGVLPLLRDGLGDLVDRWIDLRLERIAEALDARLLGGGEP